MRPLDHVLAGCPQPIHDALERFWGGKLNRAGLDYWLAHWTAVHLDDCRYLPDPTEPTVPMPAPHMPAGAFEDATKRWAQYHRQRADVHGRNCARRESLDRTALVLRLGDPSVPMESRESKSLGDYELAARVEAFAVEQFGAAWREYNRDRQRG